jgi:hypothetical protein
MVTLEAMLITLRSAPDGLPNTVTLLLKSMVKQEGIRASGHARVRIYNHVCCVSQYIARLVRALYPTTIRHNFREKHGGTYRELRKWSR